MIVAAGRTISESDLPETIRAQESPQISSQLELTLPMSMEEIEKMVINKTLLLTGGDKAKASRLLGIGRKTLYRKLDEYRRTG